MINPQRPLTPEEIERIKESGISFEKGIYIEGIKLFELRRKENNDVLYYHEDLSQGTGWIDAEHALVINGDYLRVVNSEKQIRYYYIPDLSQFRGWFDTTDCRIYENMLVGNGLGIIQTKIIKFLPTIPKEQPES